MRPVPEPVARDPHGVGEGHHRPHLFDGRGRRHGHQRGDRRRRLVDHRGRRWLGVHPVALAEAPAAFVTLPRRRLPAVARRRRRRPYAREPHLLAAPPRPVPALPHVLRPRTRRDHLDAVRRRRGGNGDPRHRPRVAPGHAHGTALHHRLPRGHRDGNLCGRSRGEHENAHGEELRIHASSHPFVADAHPRDGAATGVDPPARRPQEVGTSHRTAPRRRAFTADCSPQTKRKASFMVQRRSRVKVRAVVSPSPVGEAMVQLVQPSPPTPMPA